MKATARESPVTKTLLAAAKCKSPSSQPAAATNHAAVAVFGNLVPSKKLSSRCS